MARPAPSRAVSGADGRDNTVDSVCEFAEERSSFRGRCRDVVGTSGDDGGSFLTKILGGGPRLAL